MRIVDVVWFSSEHGTAGIAILEAETEAEGTPGVRKAVAGAVPGLSEKADVDHLLKWGMPFHLSTLNHLKAELEGKRRHFRFVKEEVTLMKLIDAVKQYEACMKEPGPCLVDDCPLHKDIAILAGEVCDEGGQVKWTVGGCTLLGRFEAWLKNKKPGTPYPD